MAEIKYPDITVQLIGTDGNAFALVGKVTQAVQRSVGKEEADAIRDEAFNQPSYDALLNYLAQTVRVI